MENNYSDRIHGIASLIGDTPLLAIDLVFNGKKATVYAKAEYLSMTGSIKDRMAYSIMQQAFRRGCLKPDSHIVEVTSGNTGISFAAIGHALGHQVTIYMPDWVSRERFKLLKSFGAEVILFGKGDGGFQANINRAEELAKSFETSFLPAQFSNKDNTAAHYNTTGPEIWYQLRSHSVWPDAFIAGVGTGGTVMGVGRFLKEKNPSIKIYPLEPANAPFLHTDHKDHSSHRIEGISDGLLPPILDMNALDAVVSVQDGDAILMAQKLAVQIGLGVGISSGANFLGALKVQKNMGRDAVVVTVFPDDNKKYLSTDLFKEESVKKGFLSPDIKLLGVEAFGRVCYKCCLEQIPKKGGS
ncbi:MAG: cysteine synthase family protein [Desulfobulbaceae bacterium]|uniref:cysteine synthase n=1 Tax=Candidatus Desulfobia pelagia TaxID=2841692 RepID=A0A8J6NFD0_9BACT|nr:cysteine synthase family protein [Candidatus Desulfobia pelagia]